MYFASSLNKKKLDITNDTTTTSPSDVSNDITTASLSQSKIQKETTSYRKI